MHYAFDEFEFDALRLELRRGGAVLKADRIVLRVLATLLRNAGRLVTKDELVSDVWDGRAVADNVITVSVARLRRALDDRRGEREFVVTVYGCGYRFVRPVLSRSTSTAPVPAPSVIPDITPPLVGRQTILAELRRGVAEAHLGRGRLCVLMGEAGIGKTRVVTALTDELAGTPSRVAWGFCREAGSTPPLYPWLQLLRKLLETGPESSWDATLGPAAAHLRRLLQADDAAGGPGASPESELSLRTVELIAHAFMHAAEATPWVLVLEDLHRADAASLEVLSLLVDEVGRSRMLVVGTLRDSLGPRAPRQNTHLPYVLGHSNTERLVLKRLGESDVLGYVAAMLGDKDGQLGRAVYAKSQGNPFFMTELVRQLRREEGNCPEDLVLPEAALDVVRQRVEGLDPQTRSLLTAAAIIGTRFELPLLQMVTGQEASAIARALDDAIAADLLVAAPDSGTAFSFAHELLRSVLYDALPAVERRRRHLETALAMERHVQSAHVSIPPGELADHFYAALPDTDLEKTVRYCDEAALAAGSAFANADVARHLKHALAALELLPSPSPAVRTNLLVRLAIYRRGSAPDVFLNAIQEAVRISRAKGDAAMLVRAAIMYHVHPEFSAMPGSNEALEHALTIIPDDEPGLRACALAALATAAPRAFCREQVRAALAEAESLVRDDVARVPMRLQVVLHSKLFSEGGPGSEAWVPKVEAELQRLWIREPARAPMVPLFMGLNRAVRGLQRGERAVASAAIERALAGAREVHHPELLWYFERFEALSKINGGECEDGKEKLLALHRRAARRPLLGSAAFCAFDRAVVLPELGETIPVGDELRRALAYQAWDAPGLWAMKVRALAAAGLTDDAWVSLNAVAPEKLADLPCDSQYLGTLGHLARAAMLLRATDYAEVLSRLLEPHETYFTGHASYFCDGPVVLLRGLLARALGRSREAQELLRRGLRMSEHAGFVLCAAEARIELARCLVMLGGPTALGTARQLANEARALGEQHGLHRCTESAARVLVDLVPTVTAAAER